MPRTDWCHFLSKQKNPEEEFLRKHECPRGHFSVLGKNALLMKGHRENAYLRSCALLDVLT